jgi:hypothetical protein
MAKKKSSPAPRKPAAAKTKAAVAAEPVATPVNGTALAVVSAAPVTSIALSLDINNMVAIGVVHAEGRLIPQLEQEVGEANRLGNEITKRAADLRSFYDGMPIDPAYEADCKDLVAAAAKVGIRLTFVLAKDGFNPDTLAYRIGVRFHGDMTSARNYTIDDDHAHELHDEIDILRGKQGAAAKAASRTKSQLSPTWLDKQLRAEIARNAMNQTEAGADTLKALTDAIDRAIDSGSGLRQLPGD